MIAWHYTTPTTAPYCPPTTTTTTVPSTTTTTSPPVTTTTTVPPTTTTTQPPATTTTTVPSGFAGISGGGENCGAGPTGHCDVPSPVATVVPPQPVLAFTGAPVGVEVGLGLALVAIGVALRYTVRRHIRHG